MNRIDLFVSPEDYPQVRALGACWDQRSKCWYVDSAISDGRFAAWLSDVATEDVQGSDFIVESVEAFVARAQTDCCRCRRCIEVVCLYCRHGTVSGEPLQAFRVQRVWAVDDALRRQLQRWPGYRIDASESLYLNHCSHCGAVQDDADLHDEPGQPFHELCGEIPHGVLLDPLRGPVRLSGDYCIEV
jgi:hypothetical protein